MPISLLEKELHSLREKLRREKRKVGSARNPEQVSRLNNRIQAYQRLLRENRAA